MTKPASVPMPHLGPQLKPEDAGQISDFLSGAIDYFKNPEPNTFVVPYTTAVPSLTKNGEAAVYWSSTQAFLYFRANGATYRVQGST